MRYARYAAGRAAIGVYLALAAQIATLTCLVVFEEVRGRQLARQVAVLGTDPRVPETQTMVGAVTWFAVLVLLALAATVAAGCSYFSWLRRAGATPGMIAIAWFVPVLNLAAPALLLYKLREDATGIRDARRASWLALLAAWWASWLATLFLIVTHLPVFRPSTTHSLTGLGPTELAVAVLAAVLCAATVREVTLAKWNARPSGLAPRLKLLPVLRSLPRHTYPAGE